jgi:hypothetical protein
MRIIRTSFFLIYIQVIFLRYKVSLCDLVNFIFFLANNTIDDDECQCVYIRIDIFF